MSDDDLHKNADPELFRYARRNRRKPTDAEELLWLHLRARQIKGQKFRRQHPIADFIVDFYCHDCKLAIELDGEYHLLTEQRDYDISRSYELKRLGIKEIRFTNEEVFVNVTKVLTVIGKHLMK